MSIAQGGNTRVEHQVPPMYLLATRTDKVSINKTAGSRYLHHSCCRTPWERRVEAVWQEVARQNVQKDILTTSTGIRNNTELGKQLLCHQRCFSEIPSPLKSSTALSTVFPTNSDPMKICCKSDENDKTNALISVKL